MKLTEPWPGVRVWEFELAASADEVANCASLLSADERERAERYVLPAVRARFIVGRARLRSILGEVLGAPAEDVEFAYGEHGKPSLQPPWSDSGYGFSLSHSANRALLVVTRHRELGCDLEAHRSLRYGPAVAKRFFSPGENVELSRVDGARWAENFFRIWTLKEAFVKALGAGLTFPTRDFTVTLDDSVSNRLIAVKREPNALDRWQLEPVAVEDGFTAAVCVARA